MQFSADFCVKLSKILYYMPWLHQSSFKLETFHFVRFGFEAQRPFVKQFPGHIFVVQYMRQYQRCIEILNPISVLLIPICFSAQYQQWLPCHLAEAGIAHTDIISFRLEYAYNHVVGNSMYSPEMIDSSTILMAWCKTAVTLLLMHLSYCCLTLSPRYDEGLF